ncbi:MFS transporter [Mesorhizobium sp. YIM 152430]|uniref:MFS transporter n=1 Tax=Mesorhizobium sp. YIM 152430 TaxID=3031761 RepID=UPI0023DBE75B|nr:MFS transporter [Mesorhizobium sp. YIM 152430]MDF1601768.1 MFS transporter [Mesorhizobium sp. YIM 152430]
MKATTIDAVLERGGTGPFQRRLLGVFGLVWTADAMQVLAVGFTAASIAATFGLTIPQALQTGTLFFLGMLIGAAVFGRLADRFGRRRILIGTVAMDAVFGIASAFAPDFQTLLLLRFLTGLAVGGTLPVDYAMMAEFLPPSRRGRWLVMLEGFWAVGTVAVALTAWAAASAGVADAWRVIFFVTALPAIAGIFLRFWIPESPMHLMRQGKEPEARAVMDKVLVANGKAPLGATPLTATPTATNVGLLSPELRRRTILMLACWFLVSISYYGIFVWMPARLATEGFGFVRGYGFLVLVALAQIPGYALAAYGVEKWGRRATLTRFLVLSAAGCALFVIATTPAMIAAALLIMSFALLGTWGALYAFTPELYPTASRATGMGAAGAMARLGGLLAPSVVVYLFIESTAAAIGLFAGLLLIAAIAARSIDVETRKAALA